MDVINSRKHGLVHRFLLLGLSRNKFIRAQHQSTCPCVPRTRIDPGARVIDDRPGRRRLISARHAIERFTEGWWTTACTQSHSLTRNSILKAAA